MSANRTDSEITEYNEDGSMTHTIVFTEYPMTGKQQATLAASLVAVCFLPLAPILGLLAVEKYQERKERRKQRKLEAVKE